MGFSLYPRHLWRTVAAAEEAEELSTTSNNHDGNVYVCIVASPQIVVLTASYTVAELRETEAVACQHPQAVTVIYCTIHSVFY